MVWNHTCNFYSKSPWIMQLPNEIQCDLHIPMEKRAKHKQKWNESKVIEKHFYNKASQKRALWLADMLAPFARRLHADAGALGSFFFFLYTKWKMFDSLNATKEMVSVQRATIELWCTREVATHERSVRVARGERDRQQYRGARRYGISLQVFNSIAHEWAQRTSEMSSWTRKRNFISTSNHVLLCLSHKRNSPLLTREVHLINEWK